MTQIPEAVNDRSEDLYVREFERSIQTRTVIPSQLGASIAVAPGRSSIQECNAYRLAPTSDELARLPFSANVLSEPIRESDRSPPLQARCASLEMPTGAAWMGRPRSTAREPHWAAVTIGLRDRELTTHSEIGASQRKIVLGSEECRTARSTRRSQSGATREPNLRDDELGARPPLRNRQQRRVRQVEWVVAPIVGPAQQRVERPDPLEHPVRRPRARQRPRLPLREAIL